MSQVFRYVLAALPLAVREAFGFPATPRKFMCFRQGDLHSGMAQPFRTAGGEAAEHVSSV